MDKTKSLRKQITMTFKLNGLAIKGDACTFLCQQLFPVPETNTDIWLSRIVDFLQRKQTLLEPVVEMGHVKAALHECCKSESDHTDDIIQVISAFEIPRFNYNIDSKKFLKCPSSDEPNTFPTASAKSALFKNRYTILKQRLDRHELLNQSEFKINFEGNSGKSAAKLNYIDRLLSSTDDVETVVLGLLSQLKEGKYFLEDPTGILPIDISKATYHPGLFTENCFVLAEGVYTDGVLQVHGLAHPPPESSKISRSYYGNVNTFGGPSEVSLKSSSRMLKFEQENEESMIVFLADVFLDRINVIQKLKLLFSGFNDDTPIAIVLMGNFLSVSKSNQYFNILRSKLNELADIIGNYENLLRETLFIIIPGPTDSPAANILPKPPLAPCITEEFTRKVPKSIFATNPCRIQYCTQEIVVLREDILTKMCRNCIHFPEPETVPIHFARTILSQSHLAPLPLSVCPIYWNYDDSLLLYPLPDVVIVADQMNPFVQTYKDTIVANPSSFSKRQFIFKVYVPGKKQIDDSQIPDI